MLCPRTGSEISSEWLQMVIESYEKTKRPIIKAQIENFDVNTGASPGESYNSELIRVDIKAKLRTEATTETTHYNLILKVHSLNIFSKEVNRCNNNHIKELNIYSKIHKQLTELQEKELDGKYKLHIPELIYGHNDGEDYVIAMRNLKSQGYTLNDKMLGLSFGQLRLAINQIARWHALSYACNEKYKLLEQFPLLNEYEPFLEFYCNAMEIAMENTYSILDGREEWKEFFLKFQNTQDVMKKMRSHVFSNTAKRPGSVYCLLHGDYWNNNLLFSYSNLENAKKKNPVDISVVDWQLCHWNRSVIDLHYLLHTSTSFEVRRDHIDDLLLEYFTVFHDVTSSLSTPIPDMTYESFKKEFREASIVGFLFGLCLTQGTLSKGGETVFPPSLSPSEIRGFYFALKTKIASFIVPLILKPSFSFLAKAHLRNLWTPIGIEIQEGKNDVLLTRLSGLIQEAIDNGTLDDINPISS